MSQFSLTLGQQRYGSLQNFDPNQKRDGDGKFSDGGGAHKEKKKPDVAAKAKAFIKSTYGKGAPAGWDKKSDSEKKSDYSKMSPGQQSDLWESGVSMEFLKK